MVCNDNNPGINRRTFMNILSVTGIAGLIYPRDTIASLLSLNTSRVVIIKDDTASSGLSINSSTVQVMINTGIKTLAQQSSVGEAWKTLLPNISTSSVVALKVNCINSSLPTHPEVAYAVANSLKEMRFSGTPFPENNIIIYDRTWYELNSSGYTINTSGSGVRCFGTNSSGVGYSSQSYSVNGISQRLSRIVTDIADYLVNISVAKSHNAVSGITLCLKNHYGTCEHPGAMHGNFANPYIPELNALNPIRSKQQVNICDAILGSSNTGPSGPPNFVANKIVMSKDIVAVDYWGSEILKAYGWNREYAARHIGTAASDYNLGTNDPAQMEVVDIINPSTQIEDNLDNTERPDDFQLKQNYPNPFNNSTVIEFNIHRPNKTDIVIYDATGRKVRHIVQKNMKQGWHQIVWDSRDDYGNLVSSGIYICQVKTNSYQKAVVMHLVR